jgi:transcriptional regulator NrdR family protein
MKCNNCPFKKTKIIDSRSVKEKTLVRRRRKCLGCGHRFTTYEIRFDERLTKGHSLELTLVRLIKESDQDATFTASRQPGTRFDVEGE